MKYGKALLTAAAMALTSTWAAAFPDKPVRMVVPYPAGGAVDSVARVVSERLSVMWGQPVVIENRPGAAGAIGTTAMLGAPADGSVLLFHSPVLISTEVTRPSVRYRTSRDLTAVSLVFSSPVFYAAAKDSVMTDLKKTLAWGAANTGQLSFGSHGDGTTTHYMGVRLKRESKVELTHVPYTGDAPLLAALMGGHLKSGFLSSASVRRGVDSGRLRVLAVASKTRSSLMPEVPTFEELGYAGFDRESWGMLLAPSATPAKTVEKIAADVDQVIRQPEVVQRLQSLSLIGKGGSVADAQRELKTDQAYWVKLVQEFGVLAE